MVSGYNEYIQNWHEFKLYIDKKVKDKCELSNKNWNKLRQWHLENYLNGMVSPFGFLFKMKYFYPEMYERIEGMPRMYGHYRQVREQSFRNKVEKDEAEQ